jgi:hypothetical protein
VLSISNPSAGIGLLLSLISKGSTTAMVAATAIVVRTIAVTPMTVQIIACYDIFFFLFSTNSVSSIFE